jgi:hypothetical protein
MMKDSEFGSSMFEELKKDKPTEPGQEYDF